MKEYSGKTEQEAIEKAGRDLGIAPDELYVEIVEKTEKRSLFGRKEVTIRVHEKEPLPEDGASLMVDENFITKMVSFLEEMIHKMDYPGKVHLGFHDNQRLIFEIESPHSSILIGRKAQNLDALQLLANVYAEKIEGLPEHHKIILDIENYRDRREEKIIHQATRAAEQVQENRSSKLLYPMNPYERRLVHMTLGDFENIITESEGDGMYKQVRIIYREERAL